MDGSPQITIADAPFDSPKKADVILRSSDNVDFYVMKALLAFSSPIFRDMFFLPQPQHDRASFRSTDNPPLDIVAIQYESAPLQNVLLLCYPQIGPGMQPKLTSDDIIEAYIIAEKYDMETVIQLLEDALSTIPPKFIRDPLRMLAIAVQHGWVDFYVLKAFLAFSSPVLRDKFAESPRSRSSSSTPRKSHPIFSPRLENADEIIAAYAVAEDFKMDAIMKQLEEMLLASKAIKEEPLRILAIAIQMGWEKVGKLAAKNTLSIPFGRLPFSNELNTITGADIWNLQDYRQSCAHAIHAWFHRNNIGGGRPWRPAGVCKKSFVRP
ncbi:unnamed protein product [Cyclocybe aegerita]|uniref:BTB domain-containing protein n=1 Tax=Cyclocybe aegerita TaxID=1973307 RepID=A0A8S0VTX1_CYCAE|nr:unnamed protein product [Cyclocybe aegerita]